MLLPFQTCVKRLGTLVARARLSCLGHNFSSYEHVQASKCNGNLRYDQQLYMLIPSKFRETCAALSFFTCVRSVLSRTVCLRSASARFPQLVVAVAAVSFFWLLSHTLQQKNGRVRIEPKAMMILHRKDHSGEVESKLDCGESHPM